MRYGYLKCPYTALPGLQIHRLGLKLRPLKTHSTEINRVHLILPVCPRSPNQEIVRLDVAMQVPMDMDRLDAF